MFIDMWNSACGQYGKYAPQEAPDTEHPFYLNELWLTYEEAVDIYNAGSPAINAYSVTSYYQGVNIRTNMPPLGLNMVYTQCDSVFQLSSVEVVRFDCFAVGNFTFLGCRNLRKFLGFLRCSTTTKQAFDGCVLLEDIENLSIYNATAVSFKDSPLLSLRTFQRMTVRDSNTATTTITVHPNVYAKLTDESNTEWHQVLIDAAAKNINFATV